MESPESLFSSALSPLATELWQDLPESHHDPLNDHNVHASPQPASVVFVDPSTDLLEANKFPAPEPPPPKQSRPLLPFSFLVQAFVK